MKFVDLRSDTVTMPIVEMRQAMIDCAVGDDVYGDDPTVNKLEKLAAQTLGKEAALFVPSGTMGNQLAIMTHTRRGDEIIISHHGHIVLHEVGAAAVLSGVSYHIVHNGNGIVCAADVQTGIREDDIHYPDTGLVCMENALGNGQVVPLDVMKGVYDVASAHSIPVHLDGARIFNAATALGVNAADIAQYADSVMFCISKGLCAPVGSLLCGRADFIAKARRNRKLLGGGMRQAGILAACGLIAVETMTKRLHIDHENAKVMASLLQSIDYVALDLSRVQINMVFFKVTRPHFDHDGFVKYLYENGVKINGIELGEYRFVTHNDIDRQDIDRVVALMRNF